MADKNLESEEKQTKENEEKKEEDKGLLPENLKNSEENPEEPPKEPEKKESDKNQPLPPIEGYVPKDLYEQSSREAVRLAKEIEDKKKEMEVIQKIVGANPQLKEGFDNAIKTGDYKIDVVNDDGTLNKEVLVQAQIEAMQRLGVVTKDDPAIQSIGAEKQAKDNAVWAEFAKKHPAIEADPRFQTEFQTMFRTQCQIAKGRGEEVGVTPTILARTWTALTGETISAEDAELKGMEKMANKQEGSQSSSTGGTGSTKKGTLTDAERRVARAMNLSDEQYLEGKKLSEEAKNK